MWNINGVIKYYILRFYLYFFKILWFIDIGFEFYKYLRVIIYGIKF